MRNNGFKDIWKKCFGKGKDERYHAVAMLAIYGIFILIVVLFIRLGSSGISSLDSVDDPSNSTIPNDTSSPVQDSTDVPKDTTDDIVGNDINYSYSYTITINGETEVYLGKKLDEKEKFTLIKNGETADYAILSDNYLKLENGIYHITESPSSYFKYCDVEKVLDLLDDKISNEKDGNSEYSVSNMSLASTFKDTMAVDNNKTNEIVLSIVNGNLKAIDLNLNNYLTSVNGEETTFTIHMEFVDIGTTENFEIKLS